jgi:hypothetical protein
MTLRRVGLIALVLIAALVAQPAAALCPVDRLDHLLRRSEAVWWATVTDARAARRGEEPGVWALTVRIEHALKGPMRTGDIGTVYLGGCGPYITVEMARRAAGSFVGETRLFVGDLTGDRALVAYSGSVRPAGLSPEQQYRRALRVLGLARPRAPSGPAGGPPWVWIGLGSLLAVVVLAGTFRIARSRGRAA